LLLKHELIAEGIETVEQKGFFLTAGVPVTQEYYYSKQLPADANKDFLIKHS